MCALLRQPGNRVGEPDADRATPAPDRLARRVPSLEGELEPGEGYRRRRDPPDHLAVTGPGEREVERGCATTAR
jgi:hypothetical protein